MAARRSFYLAPLVLLSAVLISYYYGATLKRTSLVLGLFRIPAKHSLASPDDLVRIEGTAHCEDLHYHEPSGLLFTACEDAQTTRHLWFPPLGIFDDHLPTARDRGSLKIIDPKTLKARSLRFENFEKPFVTHGIDVFDDPRRNKGEAIYIFAVNHVPNVEYYGKGRRDVSKSRSVVEIFHYTIGSDSVKHIRTVWHPLLTTPNDILALSPESFLVTNDHFYREGVMRQIEDLHFGARWTDTVHVRFLPGDGTTAAKHDADGVEASVALGNMHNNNGIGRGKGPRDVLVTSASSGVLHLGTRDGSSTGAPQTIKITETIELDSTIDNPSYFADPYANGTFDASGVVVCGLSRAVDILKNGRIPDAVDGIMVWMVSPSGPGDTNPTEKWTKRLLFQDDGTAVRSCSAAVLVPNEPSAQDGRRQAQLFVTGFLSNNMASITLNLGDYGF
ncbi:hypothetical protein CDD83_5932 [Cordyceps sp. RAO-2017]|nr:hypothetical protein CDD83_5932 [Cordyceps sp. RAO-2017]